MKRVVATLMLSLLVVATAQAAPRPVQEPVPYVSNEEAAARLSRACRSGPQECEEYASLLSYCHGMRGIAITAASMRDKIGKYREVLYLANNSQRPYGSYAKFYIEPEHVQRIVALAFESRQPVDEFSSRLFAGCLEAWDDLH